ncbi:hypothetical protein HYV80_03155 [Candidatus Woesearchaeota archaeon]|nr:hypothetical protein [Candidatus Woesearchaeota archaeon]
MLRKININPSKDNRFQEIIMPGYINFKIFNELNIARIHPEKYEKFTFGYSNLLSSNANGLTKIKIIELLKSQSLTRYQIAEKLNRDISIVHKMLRDLEIKDVVKRIGKEKSFRKSRDIWKLSKIPENLFNLMTYDYDKINS